MSKQKFNFGVPNLKKVNSESNKENVNAAEEKKEVFQQEKNVLDVPKKFEKFNSLDLRDKRIFDIKYILRSKIRENKKNKYPKEALDKMKESILYYGLQQNLTVVYLEEEDIYVLEAGHTRTRALDELIEEFTDLTDETDERVQLFKKNVEEYKLKGYPCKVSAILADNIKYDFEDNTDLKDIPDDVIDSEIRLIITNEVNRNRTPITIAANVERLEKLYNRKNIGKKHTEKINVANQIANDLGVKKNQIIKYSSLKNLIPELREEFEKNNITLTDSSNYAKLNEEEQKTILELLKAGQKVTSAEVTTLLKDKNDLAKKLAAKEEKIKQLEKEKKEAAGSGSDSLNDQNKIIEKKDTEILLLKKELELIKDKQKETSKSVFNKEQSVLVKNDLTTRTAFDSAKRAIRDYIESKNNLISIITNTESEDVKSMSITTETDIQSQIKQLIEILESALKKEDE